MARSTNYNTRQRDAILEYITSIKDAHVTAAQIVEYFASENKPIGRTTIYRHLDKLVDDGKLRRYVTDGISGACYQHAADLETCHVHMHLKCEDCGELQHLDCEALDDIRDHFLAKHSFTVNAMKTVLYGKCANCSKDSHDAP
ncbi:MAG: transcriptional repressor [Oscillospiraceae bacterium]|nr:transcriptional repressor [Oscillospiraceae bacterium]